MKTAPSFRNSSKAFLAKKINSYENRLVISTNQSKTIKNINKKQNVKDYTILSSDSLPLFNKGYLLSLSNQQRYSGSPNFKKKIDDYDKLQCKKIVNTSAATCAGIAGAVGKASAFGIDPWLQRGIQSTMFLYLADYLEVSPSAATYYAGVELCSGARLGVEAGKILTSIGGIIADVATAGVSVGATEGITRGSNAALSFYITRRMGNNFIKQVENNNMTAQKQLMRGAQYGLKKAMLGGFHVDESISEFDEIMDIDEYKELLKNIPDSDKSLIGEIYDNFFQPGLQRTPSVFLANIMPTLIFNGVKSSDNNKNMIKDALKSTLMTTAIYDLCNIGVDEELTQYAIKKYDDLNKTIFENSEVYESFNEMSEKVARKIRLQNIDKMDSKEFLKQFKNKEFVFELSRTVEMEIKAFNKKLKEAKKEKFQNVKVDLINKSAGFRDKVKQASEAENTNERKIINEKIQSILLNSSENKKTNEFGFNTIAGYESEKIKLNNAIGTLLQAGDMESFELPNVILLYGPRGVGKTTMSMAAAGEYGCCCIKKTFVGNKTDILNKIEKIANDARKQYETSDVPRHTILIIDECTSFISVPETEEDKKAINKFKDFIKNCAEKYHITVFMTTNYPELIEPEILNNKVICLRVTSPVERMASASGTEAYIKRG